MTRPHAGFTAIELLVVMATMMVLTAIALPYIGQSLQRSRVNEATNIVNFACSEARRMAQSERDLYKQIEAGVTRVVPFGVRIVAATTAEPGYAVMLGWQPGATEPVEIDERRTFNRNVTFANATVDLDLPGEALVQDEITIWFQYRTGFFGTRRAADGSVIPATAPLVLRMATTDYAWDAAAGEVVRGIANETTFFHQVGVTHDR